MTQPTFSRSQFEREAISFAVAMKYSSQLGRRPMLAVALAIWSTKLSLTSIMASTVGIAAALARGKRPSTHGLQGTTPPLNLRPMVSLQQLVDHCDKRTRRPAFKDFPGAHNGLQVANDGRVTRIGAAVDAGLVPFEQAAERGVDFLIVHHGLYWGGVQPLVGPAYGRFAALVRGNCAVYSSHLPLDAHEELGNNVVLARQLGLKPRRRFLPHEGEFIGWIAANKRKRSQLCARLEELYPRVVTIDCGSAVPKQVAFCSGSGNSAV